MKYNEPRWGQRFRHSAAAVGGSQILLIPEVIEEFSIALSVPTGATVSARIEYTLAQHTDIHKAIANRDLGTGNGGNDDAIEQELIWLPWGPGDLAQGNKDVEMIEYPISAVRAYVAALEAGKEIVWEILGDRSGISPVKLIG